MSKSPFSIITTQTERCYICGATRSIEFHHIFGASNRNNSTEHGLVVPLCHWCHNEPPEGVHHNKSRSDALKRLGQKKFEETHSRDEFMKIFGRNYLDD